MKCSGVLLDGQRCNFLRRKTARWRSNRLQKRYVHTDPDVTLHIINIQFERAWILFFTCYKCIDPPQGVIRHKFYALKLFDDNIVYIIGTFVYNLLIKCTSITAHLHTVLFGIPGGTVIWQVRSEHRAQKYLPKGVDIWFSCYGGQGCCMFCIGK